MQPLASLRLLITALALALLLVGCPSSEPWVEVKGKRFLVEIADDDASRARGLMFRDHLPENRGMLFIFRQEQPRSFWMRNTRIPLDIIYLDRDFRVVSMALEAQPCRTRQCPTYPSRRPAMYVLEINGGLAEQLGLAVGDQLSFGNIPGLSS